MYKESHYGVLHLPLNATVEQIAARARELEQAHIDRACVGDVQAVLRLREIRAARNTLCHPAYRATYDRAYVAAIAAHLRYEPPRAGEPLERETWMVFNAGPGHA